VTDARRAAARRVLNAMTSHPDHLSAVDSPLARLVRQTDGNVIAKTGAEGYLVACVRDKALGIAIKVADGDNSGRARMGVLARILGRIDAMPAEEAELMIAAVEPAISDGNGREVGRVEIVVQRPQPTEPTRASLGFWLSGVPGAGALDYLLPAEPRR
jgi:L-asparaginase II